MVCRSKRGVLVFISKWERELFDADELKEYVEIRAVYQVKCTEENASPQGPKDCNGMVAVMRVQIQGLGLKLLWSTEVRSGNGIGASFHVATGILSKRRKVARPVVVLDPIVLGPGMFLSPTLGKPAQQTMLNGLQRFTWQNWITTRDANYGTYNEASTTGPGPRVAPVGP
jgi:hypothetical protein